MLTISETWLQEANLNESELKIELALALLERRRISFPQACELSELSVLEFLQHVQQRGIELEYDELELMHDVKVLRQLGRL